MKRTPLKRRTRLRSTFRRLDPDRKRSTYATRERDTEYMLFVKTLPCYAWNLGDCDGVVEADHAGRRGLSRKAPDNTCIPLCTKHHAERTDFSGAFKGYVKQDMRDFLATAIVWTRLAAQGRGVEVPP